MANERIIKQTTIKGIFVFPIGWFYSEKRSVKDILVSTVRLDGGHLEDPLGICETETGFETMVFLEGSAVGGTIYVRQYKTLAKAKKGHDAIVAGIMDGSLPLAVPLNYSAWEQQGGDVTERAKRMASHRAA